MAAGQDSHSKWSPGAALLVGLAGALVLTILPDAVLLPAVDRWPPRHVGLLLAGLLLSAGWRLGAGSGARTLTLRSLLIVGATAVAGCLLSAAALPALRDFVAAGLRGESTWLSYYPLVSVGSAAVLAPAAVPLGALLAFVCGDRYQKPVLLLALGAAAGFLLGPWLGEVLLGPERTLQVAALLAASATLLLVERQPLRIVTPRLAPGSLGAVLALGVTFIACCRLLEIEGDRGSLTAPGLAAAACLGVALGGFTPRLAAAPLLAASLAAAPPLLFPAEAFVLHEPQRILLRDALRLGAVGLPIGLALGVLLRAGSANPQSVGPHSRGLHSALLPGLLVLLAPAASYLLLPSLGPRHATSALAVGAALLALPAVGWRWVPMAILAGVVWLSLAGVGPALQPGMLPAHDRQRLPDGEVSFVHDPATGRELLALDGRAPFGRSAEQQRRFAHLPLLLHPAPRRVLVVEPGQPVTARAAWSHGPETLHWLLGFSHISSNELLAWPGSDPPTFGTERQFLAKEREAYDVILFAPDPRIARRSALLGTVEFFRLAEQRLAPRGLFCQWWDLADVDVSDLKTIISSAAEVFPHRYLMVDHPRTRRACVGLLLCREPLSVPPERLDQTLAMRPEVTPDFEHVGLDGLSVACLIIADRGMLELLAPQEDALHDDRPLLSVRGALRNDSGAQRLREGLATWMLRRGDPMAWVAVSPDMAKLIAPIVRDRYRSWQHLFGGAAAVVATAGPTGVPFERDPLQHTPPAEDEALLEALAPLPDWAYLSRLVLDVAVRLERDSGLAAAETWLRRAIEKDEGSAALRFALARLVERKGDRTDALLLYRTVLAFAPEHEAAKEAIERLVAQLDEAPER